MLNPLSFLLRADDHKRMLWDHAQEIAEQYPQEDRARYQQAATNFRVPYWDWSLNSTMPDVINSPMITINTPMGSQQISNPLYTYTFHPLTPSDLPDVSVDPRLRDCLKHLNIQVADSNVRSFRNITTLYEHQIQLPRKVSQV